MNNSEKHKVRSGKLLHMILFFYVLLSGIICVFIELNFLRVIFGIPNIFVVPGLLLVGILWPDDAEIDPLWRVSLTIPSSIALISLILLSLNYFWEYRYETAVTLIVILNLVLLGGHYYRTNKKTGYLNAFMESFSNQIREYKFRFSFSNILLTVSVLFLLGAISYAAVLPGQQVYMTEFYILNPDRSLPLGINLSNANNSFIIGISNHEGEEVFYSYAVQALTTEEEILLHSEFLLVEKDEFVEKSIDFNTLPENTVEVQILLYKDDASIAYRKLKLIVK